MTTNLPVCMDKAFAMKDCMLQYGRNNTCNLKLKIYGPNMATLLVHVVLKTECMHVCTK